jgi:hypothetical protein
MRKLIEGGELKNKTGVDTLILDNTNQRIYIQDYLGTFNGRKDTIHQKVIKF